MAVVRTLAQIDTALTAVEGSLPRINTGLQTTLRQNNLVLEAGIGELKDIVGVPANTGTGAPATGLFADIAALTALVQDLRDRVTTLETAALTWGG